VAQVYNLCYRRLSLAATFFCFRFAYDCKALTESIALTFPYIR